MSLPYTLARLATLAETVILLPLTQEIASRGTAASFVLLLGILFTLQAQGRKLAIAPSVHYAVPFIIPALLLLSFQVERVIPVPLIWLGKLITFASPLFVLAEPLQTLLVIQGIAKTALALVESAASDSFSLIPLLVSGSIYAVATLGVLASFSSATSSSISATLLGAALAVASGLTVTGFVLRRSSALENAMIFSYLSYNVYLIGCAHQGCSAALSGLGLNFTLRDLAVRLDPDSKFAQAAIALLAAVPIQALVAAAFRAGISMLAARITPTLRSGSVADNNVDALQDMWSPDAITSAEEQESVLNPDKTTSIRIAKLQYNYRDLWCLAIYTNLLILDTSSMLIQRWCIVGMFMFLWITELALSKTSDVGNFKME